jgi:hypothetical protein
VLLDRPYGIKTQSLGMRGLIESVAIALHRGLVGAARELKMKSEFHAASPVRLVLVDIRPA